MDEVAKGDAYPYWMHWAGATRTPLLKKMTRSDILLFFSNCYYKKIPLGKLKQFLNKLNPAILYYTRIMYYKLKHNKWKNFQL